MPRRPDILFSTSSSLHFPSGCPRVPTARYPINPSQATAGSAVWGCSDRRSAVWGCSDRRSAVWGCRPQEAQCGAAVTAGSAVWGCRDRRKRSVGMDNAGVSNACQRHATGRRGGLAGLWQGWFRPMCHPCSAGISDVMLPWRAFSTRRVPAVPFPTPHCASLQLR